MEAGRDLDELIRWTWDLEHTDWAVSTDCRDAVKFMAYTGRLGFDWSIRLNNNEYTVNHARGLVFSFGEGIAHSLPLAIAQAAFPC